MADTSWLALAKPTVELQDPNTLLRNAASAQNAVNQNRLFQAQQAAGQAMQQATDANGNVNMQTFNRLLAGNPLAAAAAMQGAQQSQGMQGAQQGLQQSRASVIGSMLGSVLQLPDGQLHDGAAAALSKAVTMGLVPADQANALAMKLPGGDNPAALRSALQQFQLSLLSPAERQGQIYGTAGTVSDNGQIIPNVQRSAMNGGAMQQAPGAVTLKASPGAAAEPRTTIGPDGQPITAPAGLSMPPGLQPAGMGGQGGAQNPMGTGRYPTPGQGAQAAPASPAGQGGASSVPGAGGVPYAGPAPGVLAGNDADALAYVRDRGDVPDANRRVQTLQQGQDALRQAITGKGSAPLQAALSILNTFNPDAAKRIGEMTGTDAAKYDEAKKYFTDYSRSSGAATHSDAQLSAAQGSNPNVDIASQAADEIASMQIGRERQRIAQVQEAQNQGGDRYAGMGYGKHASNFASSTDPRGFAWDRYSPDQRQAIIKSVSKDPTAMKKLQRAVGIASRPGFGWVQTPGTTP